MRLRQEGLAWRRTGEEIIVLDSAGGEYFVLNATGAVLWDVLQKQEVTLQALQDRLCAEFDVELDVARRDVAAFTELLSRLELIEDTPGQG